MADNVETNFKGIWVRPGGSNRNLLQEVNAALARINSTVSGRLLLSGIAEDGRLLQGTYKVVIVSPTHYTPTNCTRAANEIHARRTAVARGQGTTSGIFWNSSTTATPDGERPSFIGLAHELIHAWRNMLGITNADPNEDEGETVGLLRPPSPPPRTDSRGRNMKRQTVTENDIRVEHGLAPRTSYWMGIHGAVPHEWQHLVGLF